jgi:ubiquinone/menaquinone biosynthesis C-methylase UbiE
VPDIYSHYRYSGATSSSYRRYLDALAAELVERFGCKNRSVMEIGCNDGYLLEQLKEIGTNQVAGFEPAVCLAPMLKERGIEVIPELFEQDSAARMPFPKADLIVVRHVLEHIEDPNAFMAAVYECLSKDGLVLIEVPDIDSIIANQLYAHFYHEHQVYYSRQTLAVLGEKHGLQTVDSRIVDIHGGSVSMIFSKRPACGEHKAPDISTCGQRYDTYATELFAYYDRLRADVGAMIGNGLRLAGYGAAHRSVSACALAGFGVDQIGFLVDKNPMLQGLFTPGSRLPIRPPDALIESADVALIFASSFEKEIVQENSAFISGGGLFKSIFPTPRFLS